MSDHAEFERRVRAIWRMADKVEDAGCVSESQEIRRDALWLLHHDCSRNDASRAEPAPAVDFSRSSPDANPLTGKSLPGASLPSDPDHER